MFAVAAAVKEAKVNEEEEVDEKEDDEEGAVRNGDAVGDAGAPNSLRADGRNVTIFPSSKATLNQVVGCTGTSAIIPVFPTK